MAAKNHTIASYYVLTALKGAERYGYDTARLLSRAGLPDYQSLYDSARWEPEKVSKLIKLIWQEMDDEFMGFTGDRCKQGVFAVMADGAINKRTLRAALRYGSHFYGLVRNDIRFSFTESGSEAVLSFELISPDTDPQHFLIEFFLLIWHRFSNWLVGKRVALKYAEFSFPAPDHVIEYSLLFPCHCRFNRNTNCIAIDKAALDLPVNQSDESLREFLKNSPADLLSKPVFYKSMTLQVMNIVEAGSFHMFPGIDQLADKFCMSSRNLRRCLKAEGESYQSIKDRLRYERAQNLLLNSKMSVCQISREIGFVESAAFSRAFKKWSGRSPKQFRERDASH